MTVCHSLCTSNLQQESTIRRRCRRRAGIQVNVDYSHALRCFTEIRWSGSVAGFFSPTWPRSASASHSVALCQQNVNRHAVIKKKEGGNGNVAGSHLEPNHIRVSMLFLIERRGRRRRREKGKGREGKNRNAETKREDECLTLLPLSLPLNPLSLLREFSQVGKFSADDTLVEMKTLRRLVDVTVIDS